MMALQNNQVSLEVNSDSLGKQASQIIKEKKTSKFYNSMDLSLAASNNANDLNQKSHPKKKQSREDSAC